MMLVLRCQAILAMERKGYFYEKEEQAIIDYVNAPTLDERNRIFNTILYPALTKMIESIIRRYKLFIPDEEFYQTFSDVFSYLLTKLNNFDPAKGCKAYSYCGTVCKNYLYYKSTQFSKNQKKSVPYDDIVEDINDNIKYSDYADFGGDNRDDCRLIKRTVGEIQKMVDDPVLNDLKPDEVKVGRALIALMDNWSEILPDDGSTKLRKSSVLFFLREETMMTTNQVRKNMKPFRFIYNVLKEIESKDR